METNSMGWPQNPSYSTESEKFLPSHSKKKLNSIKNIALIPRFFFLEAQTLENPER